MRQEGKRVDDVAVQLKRHGSTIYRELKRNRDKELGYLLELLALSLKISLKQLLLIMVLSLQSTTHCVISWMLKHFSVTHIHLGRSHRLKTSID